MHDSIYRIRPWVSKANSPIDGPMQFEQQRCTRLSGNETRPSQTAIRRPTRKPIPPVGAPSIFWLHAVKPPEESLIRASRGHDLAHGQFSAVAENQQWAYVSGDRGYVHLADFVLPFFGNEVAFEVNAPAFQVTGCRFNMENNTRRLAVHEYSNNAANAQETRMVKTFSHIILSGKLEPRWAEQALNTQRVFDACLRSARENGRIVEVL